MRKEIMPFVNLKCIETPKFKTGILSINLLLQLDRETASKNALLPRVLLRGSEKHPDMESIAVYCEELYGTKLSSFVRKKGEIHCVGLYSSFVDDRYIDGEDMLLEKVTELIGEILLEPKLSDGLFTAEYMEGEKNNLIDEIRGIVNDKGSYSINQIIKNMCDGEPYATSRLGSEEEAEAIDTKCLTDYYNEILSTATIEVFYCGSANEERVETAVKSALEKLPRTEPDYDIGTDVRMNTLEENPRYYEEEMDVTQGKLALGFRLGEIMEDPEYAQIMLFNYIYGGSVNSKLFMNVREKLSLCYYASSILERHKGIMIVASGIEFDKFDEAKREILLQLENMREGEITQEEFLNAKKQAITDMCALGDSQGALEDFYLAQTIEGEDFGPDEMMTRLEQVTLEQCIVVAKSVELDAIYFLKGFDDVTEVAQ